MSGPTDTYTTSKGPGPGDFDPFELLSNEKLLDLVTKGGAAALLALNDRGDFGGLFAPIRLTNTCHTVVGNMSDQQDLSFLGLLIAGGNFPVIMKMDDVPQELRPEEPLDPKLTTGTSYEGVENLAIVLLPAIIALNFGMKVPMGSIEDASVQASLASNGRAFATWGKVAAAGFAQRDDANDNLAVLERLLELQPTDVKRYTKTIVTRDETVLPDPCKAIVPDQAGTAKNSPAGRAFGYWQKAPSQSGQGIPQGGANQAGLLAFDADAFAKSLGTTMVTTLAKVNKTKEERASECERKLGNIKFLLSMIGWNADKEGNVTDLAIPTLSASLENFQASESASTALRFAGLVMNLMGAEGDALEGLYAEKSLRVMPKKLAAAFLNANWSTTSLDSEHKQHEEIAQVDALFFAPQRDTNEVERARQKELEEELEKHLPESMRKHQKVVIERLGSITAVQDARAIPTNLGIVIEAAIDVRHVNPGLRRICVEFITMIASSSAWIEKHKENMKFLAFFFVEKIYNVCKAVGQFANHPINISAIEELERTGRLESVTHDELLKLLDVKSLSYVGSYMAILRWQR